MKLSIVIPFCDKDAKMLENLIQNIRQNVKISHEIILVDNREDDKTEFNFSETKIVTQNRNLGQFEARLFAVQYCSGEYVWYVDADDRVLEVAQKFETVKSDMVCFNVYEVRQEGRVPQPESERRENLFSEKKYVTLKTSDYPFSTVYKLVKNALWSCWIRREILEEVAEIMPRNKNFKHNEDLFTQSVCYLRAETILFCADFLYEYNVKGSFGYSENFMLSKFEYLFKDILDLHREAKRVLKGRYYDVFNLFKDAFCASCYINKLEEKDYENGVLLLIKFFGVDNILSFAQEECDSNHFDYRFIATLNKILMTDLKFYPTFFAQKIEKLKPAQTPTNSKIKCYSKNSLEILIREKKIQFRKCCHLPSDELLGEIDIAEYLKIKNKYDYLDSVSRHIPPNHHYWFETIEQDCDGSTCCYFATEKLKSISVSNISCNINCVMCKDDIYINDDELESYFQILESVKGLNLDSIMLTNHGEPFLRKERTFQFLESLTPSDCKIVWAITNATLIDRSDIDRLTRLKVKPMLIVSCDGITAETYGKIRRNNKFDRVIDNIRYIAEKDILNVVNIVVSSSNLHELCDMPRFYEELGVPLEKLMFLMCGTQKMASGWSNSLEENLKSDELKKFKTLYPTANFAFPFVR